MHTPGYQIQGFPSQSRFLARWPWVRNIPSLSLHRLPHLHTEGEVWMTKREDVGILAPHNEGAQSESELSHPFHSAKWVGPLFPLAALGVGGAMPTAHSVPFCFYFEQKQAK